MFISWAYFKIKGKEKMKRYIATYYDNTPDYQKTMKSIIIFADSKEEAFEKAKIQVSAYFYDNIDVKEA